MKTLNTEFGAIESIESYVTVPRKINRNKIIFTQYDLRSIVADILGIDLNEWIHLTDKRGTKPVKAALKLGADESLAQLIGDLRLAVTAEEIDKVYADERCKSCMTGLSVGPFWYNNKVGVIYAPNFRVLVGLTTRGLCSSSYGYKRDKVEHLISPYFDNTQFPVPSSYNRELVHVYKGSKYTTVINYAVWTVIMDDFTRLEEIKDFDPEVLVSLVNKGLKERDNNIGEIFFSSRGFTSRHKLPSPYEGEYEIYRESRLGFDVPASMFSGSLPDTPEYREASKHLGKTFIEIKDECKAQILEVYEIERSDPIFEIEDLVIQKPTGLIFDDNIDCPFIDIEDRRLDHEEAQGIIELYQLENEADLMNKNTYTKDKERDEILEYLFDFIL